LARRADPEKSSPDTREEILEAAERLIALHGIEGFQLTDVARAVGIRPPSIYAHFDGRDAIAREVAHRLYRGIQAELEVDRFERGDPTKELRRLVRKAVRYYAQRPAHLRLTLRDLAQTAFPRGDGETSPVPVWNEIAESFALLVRRGVAAGQFRRLRPAAAHAQIVGAILLNLCWDGWDEEGNPIPGVPLGRVERESEEMALRVLRASNT
jgi:AcrR family transcriptional regulator